MDWFSVFFYYNFAAIVCMLNFSIELLCDTPKKHHDSLLAFFFFNVKILLIIKNFEMNIMMLI